MSLEKNFYLPDVQMKSKHTSIWKFTLNWSVLAEKEIFSWVKSKEKENVPIDNWTDFLWQNKIYYKICFNYIIKIY